MRRVASRNCMGFWDREDRSEIAKARIDYDAGKIELVQKREGNDFVLYAIDRVTPAAPRFYFVSNTEG
jgi:hypothetical protein